MKHKWQSPPHPKLFSTGSHALRLVEPIETLLVMGGRWMVDKASKQRVLAKFGVDQTDLNETLPAANSTEKPTPRTDVNKGAKQNEAEHMQVLWLGWVW